MMKLIACVGVCDKSVWYCDIITSDTAVMFVVSRRSSCI